MKHLVDDPFRLTVLTAGGDEYDHLTDDTIRVLFKSPEHSLSFPFTPGDRIVRQKRSFPVPKFSDYPWRACEGWVRYLSLRVGDLEAHVYPDGHLAIQRVNG